MQDDIHGKRQSHWYRSLRLIHSFRMFDNSSQWTTTLGASMITVVTCSRSCKSINKGPSHWYRSLRLIHSFQMLDDPSYWMTIFRKTANTGHTVDAGVRMSAHAFAAKVKVWIYYCVSAFLATTTSVSEQQVTRARMKRARDSSWPLLLNRYIFFFADHGC